MWWIYALAFGMMLVNTVIVLWLIDRENDAADPGPSRRRPHRGPMPPRPRGDRMPVAFEKGGVGLLERLRAREIEKL